MPVPPVARTTPTQPLRRAGAPDTESSNTPRHIPRQDHKDAFSSSRSVFDVYKINWVRRDDGTQFVIRSRAIDIEAPIDQVWETVKNVERYRRFSSGAVWAHVDGEVAVGKDIVMKIFPKTCAGKLMGTSRETIHVVDHTLKIIGWARHLPIGGKTERYHVLEAIGPHTTRSYIALKMPGILGAAAAFLFGPTIRRAFKALHSGIKLHSERLTEK